MDPDEIIVTKTDPTGKIRYANRTFYKYAGYEPSECVGAQHNIIRHPGMPRSVFKLFWDTLKSGGEIFAYVNNRSKNGDFYWVLAHATPSFDASGAIIGYHSNRRAPNRQVVRDHIEPLYRDLLALERSANGPKEALDCGGKAISDALKEKSMSFNEMMFSLGA